MTKILDFSFSPVDKILADLTKLEEKHVKNFPVGTTIGEKGRDNSNEEGFFIIMLGRHKDSEGFAKIIAANMSPEEIISGFSDAIGRLIAPEKKIGIA